MLHWEDTPAVLPDRRDGHRQGDPWRTRSTPPSARPEPFIEVKLHGAPRTLMEAELFGYERGAFTDAKESKPGLVEAVRRVPVPRRDRRRGSLGAGQAAPGDRGPDGRRVGSVRERKVDVRIVAATNVISSARRAASGSAAISISGLAVIVLVMPPLRERVRTYCSSPTTSCECSMPIREDGA